MTYTHPYTYQQVVLFARQLPLTERAQLVRDILAEPGENTPQSESSYNAMVSRETLYGIFAGQGPVPSEEELRESRREMWMKFFQ